MSISFAVQGDPASREEWLKLATRAEDLGFEALSLADHPGTTASPFVALAAAAQVTTRLLLAPAVINSGAWGPLALAAEVATLDVVSDGRVVLGIGAGHTPREWIQIGRPYPTAPQRVAHLEVVVSSVRRLLAGERVTVEHDTVHLHDAALEWPMPARTRVPILIGGNARALVGVAARHGDVLELTGLGRTLPDGHAHEPQWSAASVEARVQLLRSAGGQSVRVGALVQKVDISSDRDSAAEAYRALLSAVIPEEQLPSIQEILNTPFVLIGTEEEIADQLRANQSRWGLSRYTTRAADLDRVASIIERLA
jgi:probable F420-dependent oxidoreductase